MTKLRYGCARMEVDKIFKLPQGSLKLDEILTIRHKFLYFNVTYFASNVRLAISVGRGSERISEGCTFKMHVHKT